MDFVQLYLLIVYSIWNLNQLHQACLNILDCLLNGCICEMECKYIEGTRNLFLFLFILFYCYFLFILFIYFYYLYIYFYVRIEKKKVYNSSPYLLLMLH